MKLLALVLYVFKLSEPSGLIEQQSSRVSKILSLMLFVLLLLKAAGEGHQNSPLIRGQGRGSGNCGKECGD